MIEQNTLKALLVFNSGKPCGWLGQTSNGFWFHYSSNSVQQHWAGLLMPPSNNFYQQSHMFPIFSQHLPKTEQEISPLEFLHRNNTKLLGALSVANPDNPVVKTAVYISQENLPDSEFHNLVQGQYLLVNTQRRKPFADTLIHHASTWTTIQTLQDIKAKVDPSNKLQALRWAMNANRSMHATWHPRPDLDLYSQQPLGFETLSSILNLTAEEEDILIVDRKRFKQIVQEVIRTYCRNVYPELALLHEIRPLLERRQVTTYIVYQTSPSHTLYSRPYVLGMEYLPTIRL